jgi:hydroxymethylglutaryl-CoA lyase
MNAPRFPALHIVEEGMREGMQIESSAIRTAAKVRLLDALSATGLREIVVGSFVRGDWVPQMRDVEDLISQMTVRPGVAYTALVLNEKGAARRQAFVPPLTVDPEPRLSVHACDIFARRNTNRSAADEIAGWPEVISRAAEAGARTATVRVNAAFGSNFTGDIDPSAPLTLLDRMITAWAEADIAIETVWLGDPMGWNTPLAVEHLLGEVVRRWPGVRRVHLHLHDQRGAAIVSAYQAIRSLPATMTLAIDTAIGGVGGCPYCGNGRATGMIATEDFVDMVEEMGIRTGIDRDLLIEASTLAEEVFGHPLYSKLALAGPRPRGPRLYPADMPLVETIEEASHFRRGPAVYDGQLRPWRRPISASPTVARSDLGGQASAGGTDG